MDKIMTMIAIIDKSEALQKAVSLTLSTFDTQLFVFQSLEEVGKNKQTPALFILGDAVEDIQNKTSKDLFLRLCEKIPVLVLKGKFASKGFEEFYQELTTEAETATLAKPFTKEELLQKVNSLISLSPLVSEKAATGAVKEKPETLKKAPFSDFSQIDLSNPHSLKAFLQVTDKTTVTTQKKEVSPILSFSEEAETDTKDLYHSTIRNLVAQMFYEDQEFRDFLSQCIRDYCLQYFPTVAKEVLTSEIRRLADEKQRTLNF